MAYPLSTVGGIGQLLANRELQRQAVSQAALNTLLNALKGEEERRRYQAEDALRREQMGRELSYRDRVMALNERNAEEAATGRRTTQDFNERMFRELELPKLKLQQDAAKTKRAMPSLQLGYEDASIGEFDPKNYGDLAPEEVGFLTRVNTQARTTGEAEYNQQKAIADAINRREMLGRYVGLSNEALKGMPARVRPTPTPKEVGTAMAAYPFGNLWLGWRGLRGVENPDIAFEKERMGDWQSELGALDRRIKPFEKGLDKLITRDPATGEAVPIKRRPSETASRPPEFYAEVNRLIEQGIDPGVAKTMALRLFAPVSGN